MRQSRPRRSLSLAAARAVALFVLVPALGLGLAIESSASAGAGAATAARTSGYGGGEMFAADPTGGYWTATAGGTVTPHGGAPTLGSPALSGLRLSKPIVGMAPTPDGGGYWLVASDGGIFNYGDAAFYGSTGAIHLNRPIVGMAATRDGHGYWLVASDGGIFSYGDAAFYGSTGSIRLNRAIVGMAATADSGGYWLVASDGGIFNYGDAAFYGSTGSLHLNRPIVGMARTPDGSGYWMVAADGGVFTFGDAGYYGSTAGTGVSALGIVIDPPAPGYAVVTTTGAASPFGPSAPAITQPTLPPLLPTTTTAPPSTTTTDPPPTTTTTTTTLPRPPATTTTTLPRTTTTTAPPSTTTTGPATATAPPTSGLQQGAYVPSVDPQGMAAFAQQTETSPTMAGDYLPSNGGWSGLDGSGGSLTWLTGPWKGSGYTLSLGVPMFPSGVGASLATGATGAYDSYFTTLAQTLVAAGQANAYLRLGWEFDGSWTAWYAGTPSAEASFATYFQQIVTSMRSVSGEHFRFVWNPDAGAFTESGYSLAAAYPGNDYVDVIGLDTYDQSWATPQTPTNAWSSTTLPSLTAALQFASAEGKPLAFPEWGVTIRSDGHGLGDDPYYINHMVSWMETSSNDVVFENYFDDDTGGVNATITGGSFPESLAAFTADLG
jgi:hypothetical protein